MSAQCQFCGGTFEWHKAWCGRKNPRIPDHVAPKVPASSPDLDRLRGEPIPPAEEIAAMRGATDTLREIANDGCGIAGSLVGPCRDETKDRSDWCWSCVASDALAKLDAARKGGAT